MLLWCAFVLVCRFDISDWVSNADFNLNKKKTAIFWRLIAKEISLRKLTSCPLDFSVIAYWCYKCTCSVPHTHITTISHRRNRIREREMFDIMSTRKLMVSMENASTKKMKWKLRATQSSIWIVSIGFHFSNENFKIMRFKCRVIVSTSR